MFFSCSGMFFLAIMNINAEETTVLTSYSTSTKSSEPTTTPALYTISTFSALFEVPNTTYDSVTNKNIPLVNTANVQEITTTNVLLVNTTYGPTLKTTDAPMFNNTDFQIVSEINTTESPKVATTDDFRSVLLDSKSTSTFLAEETTVLTSYSTSTTSLEPTTSPTLSTISTFSASFEVPNTTYNTVVTNKNIPLFNTANVQEITTTNVLLVNTTYGPTLNTTDGTMFNTTDFQKVPKVNTTEGQKVTSTDDVRSGLLDSKPTSTVLEYLAVGGGVGVTIGIMLAIGIVAGVIACHMKRKQNPTRTLDKSCQTCDGILEHVYDIIDDRQENAVSYRVLERDADSHNSQVHAYITPKHVHYEHGSAGGCSSDSYHTSDEQASNINFDTNYVNTNRFT
ncbi:hypothetical protein DPMN_077845 [Dreissena polymorpha]|uniref:Uncharacterized protein n=2 Tax=Dreissena polymorpha TaxID=45954 RepID=A0A9D3YQ39_DREPO|nr:hypothetical protein DPMN_077845 [Dreissena polymorpha]